MKENTITSDIIIALNTIFPRRKYIPFDWMLSLLSQSSNELTEFHVNIESLQVSAAMELTLAATEDTAVIELVFFLLFNRELI